MQLHVLSGINTTDPGRILSRADQIRADCAGAGQETTSLDLGLAVFSPDCPDIPDVNRIFFARVFSDLDSEKWFESAVQFYESRSTRLRCITPVRSETVSGQNSFIRLLQDRGWKQMELDILRLNQAIRFEPLDEQIVSARAVMRLYESSVHALFQPPNSQRANLMIRKLDDPRYEVLVILRARQIVAQAGLITAGEVGLIEEVHSANSDHDGLLGKTIMGAVTDLCTRAQLKHVFTVIDPADPRAQDFHKTLGFSKIGSETSFILPDSDKD